MPTRLALVASLLLLSCPALAVDTVCLGPSSQTGAITIDFCGGATATTGQIGFATEGTPCGSGTCETGDPPSPTASNLTVSNTFLDPNDNTGPIVGGQLFVWLECAETGATRVRCSVETNLNVIAFTATNGFTNSGTSTDLDLSTPCTNGPVMAGILTVESSVPVTPKSWGRIKSAYTED